MAQELRLFARAHHLPIFSRFGPYDTNALDAFLWGPPEGHGAHGFEHWGHEAAVMPLALMTCHDALVTQGQLKPGGSLLVNGASSGVGIAMMLVAKALGAKLIAGTSRDPEKQKKLPDYGATLVLDSSKPDWPDKLLAATGGKGVEVVADMVDP